MQEVRRTPPSRIERDVEALSEEGTSLDQAKEEGKSLDNAKSKSQVKRALKAAEVEEEAEVEEHAEEAE